MATVKFSPEKRYSVYVLDVVGGDPQEVYVGESWNEPAVRRQQHLDGVRRGKVFKRKGRRVGELRPDLVPHLEPLTTRELARAAEACVAQVLMARGYTVHGGH